MDAYVVGPSWSELQKTSGPGLEVRPGSVASLTVTSSRRTRY